MFFINCKENNLFWNLTICSVYDSAQWWIAVTDYLTSEQLLGLLFAFAQRARYLKSQT